MTSDELKYIVAIYLRGEHLQPAQVSDVLGIQASRVQTKGDLRVGSRTAIVESGVWAIIAQTKSPDITDHIDELLKKLGKQQMSLTGIPGVEEAYLDILAQRDDESGDNEVIEFVIDKEYVSELSRLGLAIQFTAT